MPYSVVSPKEVMLETMVKDYPTLNECLERKWVHDGPHCWAQVFHRRSEIKCSFATRKSGIVKGIVGKGDIRKNRSSTRLYNDMLTCMAGAKNCCI